MRRRNVNQYILVGIGAVLVYSILLYLGTAYLQKQLAYSLQTSTAADTVDVQLRPSLPLGLVTGNFSTVRLVLKRARLGPIDSQTVVFNGSEMDVSILQLIKNQVFALDRVGETSARLDLSEEDLNRYFDTLALPDGLIKAEITQDAFRLTGDIPLAGRELQISLFGNLMVLPDNYLQIVPEKLVIENAEMPAILVERLLADYLVIPVNLASLPVELNLTEVDLKEGLVSVFAR